MNSLSEAYPEEPDIFDLWDYLEREPVMLRVLQEYMDEAMRSEIALQTRLEEVEKKLREFEGQNAQEAEPASQEPAYNEEEAEWAPLPKENDEAESWLHEAEWAPLPDESDDEEPEMPVMPMETEGGEPELSIREIVLRSRTIEIPVLVTPTALAAAAPEDFHPADLGDLPEQFRMELRVPQAEAYTVVRGEGNNTIVCGICSRQFETIKGWRIHSSRMHKQDGFCARCGHYLLLPPNYTAAQKVAALELHNLDWCPRSCAAVIKERQVKRRRLHLVGREDCLFIPGQ